MKASTHRYLDVDLTHERIADFEVPPSWIDLHLGGRGIGARILWHELQGNELALDPANILIFATGPFQGTGLAGAGRHAVLSVSPKTGTVADSYVGGFFGHELARTGYDGVILRGRAASPVVLAISPSGPWLRPADDLWGMGTGKAEETLREEFPAGRVASIGPAGENLVHMACIVHDRSRAAGRPGFGAVMGAKQVKAVVVQGSQARSVADPSRFKQERAEFTRIFTGPAYKGLGEHGTARLVLANQEVGLLPTRNFQQGTFEHADSISAERLASSYLVGRETCAGCPIRCKRVVRSTYKSMPIHPEFGGPEYETLAAFGSLCLCNDLAAICLANQQCNDLGLDTISVGVTAAFLMEASEAGLTSEQFAWGDPSVVLRLIDDLGHRRGLGELLAEGIDPLANKWNVAFNMTIKGVEIPMHDPRGKQGLGISYATSPRGATHLEGMHDTMIEVDRPAAELGLLHGYDRFTLHDKAHVSRVFEDLRSFENSLVLCCFVARSAGPSYRYPKLRSLLEAATGISLSAEEMLAVGTRNYTLTKLHALRSGQATQQDRLPARFHEPLPDGASAGHPIIPAEMAETLAAYYEDRGYDGAGIPKQETLSRLGLGELVADAPSPPVAC